MNSRHDTLRFHQQIIQLYGDGLAPSKIAKEVKCSKALISYVLRKRTKITNSFAVIEALSVTKINDIRNDYECGMHLKDIYAKHNICANAMLIFYEYHIGISSKKARRGVFASISNDTLNLAKPKQTDHERYKAANINDWSFCADDLEEEAR